MTRYEVEFSPKALVSLREVARFITRNAGGRRARDWVEEITQSTATLEGHPHAFPVVGQFEGEDIHARFIMRHVLYYFVDESAQVVTIIDIVHTARETAREHYEDR